MLKTSCDFVWLSDHICLSQEVFFFVYYILFSRQD